MIIGIIAVFQISCCSLFEMGARCLEWEAEEDCNLSFSVSDSNEPIQV